MCCMLEENERVTFILMTCALYSNILQHSLLIDSLAQGTTHVEFAYIIDANYSYILVVLCLAVGG